MSKRKGKSGKAGKTSKYAQKLAQGRRRQPGYQVTDKVHPLARFDRLVESEKDQYAPLRQMAGNIVSEDRLWHLVAGLQAGIKAYGVKQASFVSQEALEAFEKGELYLSPQQRGSAPTKAKKGRHGAQSIARCA